MDGRIRKHGLEVKKQAGIVPWYGTGNPPQVYADRLQA